MDSNLPKGSICVPVYNESENIGDLYEAFCRLAVRLESRVELELVFTDNNSSDDSWETIRSICSEDNRICGYRFGRNIGYQKSILFNFQQATGDFVVQFDADLQDPPEIIEEMILAWLDGKKLVSAVRKKRAEGFFINLLRALGYKFLSNASEGILAPNVGDFRLIDREVLRYILKTNNPSPYLRGMISKLGFVEHYIAYTRRPRFKGKSKFPLVRILSLGWNGFLTFSKWPILFYNFLTLVSLLFTLGLVISLAVMVFAGSEIPLQSFILLVSLTVIIVLSVSSSAIMLFYLRQLYEVVASHDLVYVENHRLERVDFSV